MKIRTKFTIIFLLTLLAPVIIIGTLAYRNVEEALKRRLGLSFEQRAHESVYSVDRNIDQVYQNVKTWSRLELMQDLLIGDMTSKITSFLIDLSREYRYFSSIDVLNAQGKVVASSTPEFIGTDLSGEQLYRDAIISKPYLQDIHLDPVTRTWVCTFAFPIKSGPQKDKVIGVISANFKAEELSSIILSIESGVQNVSSGHVMLLRKDGLIIAAPDSEKKDIFTRNLIQTGLRPIILARQREAGYNINIDEHNLKALVGYDYSRGYRDFPGFGWVLYVTGETNKAFAPVARLKYTIFLVGILMSLSVIILSYFVTGRLVEPMLKMSRVASGVAKGDFESRVEHDSRDEIGELARVFNQMVTDLKEQRAKLVDKEELQRNYDIQYVLNSLLNLSLQDISLDKFLDNTLYLIFSIPQSSFEKRGSIFLADQNSQILQLYAQRGLSEAQKNACAQVPFGRCLCGRAALTREVQFSRCLDDRHEIVYEGIKQHGHYCIPIVSAAKVLGVINLYVKEGAVYSAKDEDFLIAVSNTLAGVIERKQSQEQLQKAYNELRETQIELIQSEKLASLGRFSSGVAHEVKNPLGIIIGGIEFLELKMQNADPEIKTVIEKLKSAVLRTDNIVKRLLSFARPSELKIETVNPVDLINDVLALIKFKFNSAKIAVNTEFSNEDILVKVDKNQIHQVLINILVNAIDAMPGGGGISIKVYKLDSLGQPRCAIEIIDTGHGIPEENMQKIFEPFFTTKRERMGTGLGLSISKTIINNHKGELVIKSKPGMGTSVRIELPSV